MQVIQVPKKFLNEEKKSKQKCPFRLVQILIDMCLYVQADDELLDKTLLSTALQCSLPLSLLLPVCFPLLFVLTQGHSLHLKIELMSERFSLKKIFLNLPKYSLRIV